MDSKSIHNEEDTTRLALSDPTIEETELVRLAIKSIIDARPEELVALKNGGMISDEIKHSLLKQVMRSIQGRANPSIIRQRIDAELEKIV